MFLSELQTYSLTHLANAPFSSASSEDNSFSFVTEKGLDILAGVRGWAGGRSWWLVGLLLLSWLSPSSADDTTEIFGSRTDGLPAAFGDFNSDEITDIFVVRDGGHTLAILLGHQEGDGQPLMKESSDLVCNFDLRITSVVPGDFNGDALMDVMVTLRSDMMQLTNQVVVLYGDMDKLSCSKEDKTSLFQTMDEPLAIDYDNNFIIDLFGRDDKGERYFWVFNNNKTAPTKIPMKNNTEHVPRIRAPHSNAFLDLNNDRFADIYITTEENFEIWSGNKDSGFTFSKSIPLPSEFSQNSRGIIGQTCFIDMELNAELNQVIPVCVDSDCKDSKILVYSNDKWHDLKVNFRDAGSSTQWRLTGSNAHHPYTEAMTLRVGDFYLDGYPDLLVTLTNDKLEYKSFLLVNVECTTCNGFSRTFEVKWNELSPHNNNTVLGVFYDFYQNGYLDVLFVQYSQTTRPYYNVSAYKSSNDLDTTFLKVMVVTGLTNPAHPLTTGTLRKSTEVYGTNLPGPMVQYRITTQDGETRMAIAAQLAQSAHFALDLPYTIFGLGRTPNFIDSLMALVSGESHEWPQLIPNSQMVVIPAPLREPRSWKARLFVTPRLVLHSALALLAVCACIFLIIAALYWKERKEDHLEKLQEAHRFHFDAM